MILPCTAGRSGCSYVMVDNTKFTIILVAMVYPPKSGPERVRLVFVKIGCNNVGWGTEPFTLVAPENTRFFMDATVGTPMGVRLRKREMEHLSLTAPGFLVSTKVGRKVSPCGGWTNTFQAHEQQYIQLTRTPYMV